VAEPYSFLLGCGSLMRQILTIMLAPAPPGKRNWSANLTLEHAGNLAVQTPATLVASTTP